MVNRSVMDVIWRLYGGIVFMYLFCSTCYLIALRNHSQIGVINSIWSCLGVVAVVIMGIFCFGETITVQQWIGIGFALIAIFLLS